MANFIEEFYYGNIDPQECSPELKSKIKKKLNELSEIEKNLSERLTGEDQKLFSEYIEKYLEFMSVSITDGFINGFRLGANFTLTTFYN